MRGKADGGHVVQLSPRSLRRGVRHSDGRRESSTHGVHRVWSRAHRAGAVQETRLRHPLVAGRRSHDARPMMQRVLALDPSTYERHQIHGDESRLWAETNCYVDIWIELLHALGHDPVAALPFTFAIDFEGDQWTFFKFPLLDLYELYGLDVQELAIWRPLVAHVEEQVSRGRPVLVELDSFYLPDTAGSAYKIAHQKSTVAITDIDVDA